MTGVPSRREWQSRQNCSVIGTPGRNTLCLAPQAKLNGVWHPRQTHFVIGTPSRLKWNPRQKRFVIGTPGRLRWHPRQKHFVIGTPGRLWTTPRAETLCVWHPEHTWMATQAEGSSCSKFVCIYLVHRLRKEWNAQMQMFSLNSFHERAVQVEGGGWDCGGHSRKDHRLCGDQQAGPFAGMLISPLEAYIAM